MCTRSIRSVYESRHDKKALLLTASSEHSEQTASIRSLVYCMRTAKVQIRLRIRTVWSGPSLFVHIVWSTDNPLYTDTRYNDTIRYIQNTCSMRKWNKQQKKRPFLHINLLIKYSVQQQIQFVGNAFWNTWCRCNEGSVYTSQFCKRETEALLRLSKYTDLRCPYMW